MDTKPAKPDREPDRTDWPGARWFAAFGLVAATAAGAYFCYLLAAPFLPPLTFALVLAVLVAPVHRAIEARLQRPNIAAMISVVIVATTIVAPATFVAQRLVVEASHSANGFQNHLALDAWHQALRTHPQVAPILDWLDQVIDLAAILRNATASLGKFAASVLRGSVLQILGVLLTFYLLFYFLRDHAVAVRTLRGLLPLSPAEADQLIDRVVDTIHATVYGSIVVAGLQGLLGGTMFWWLGLPAPLLWGFVMALLSLVPVLGAFVVWIPTAVYLALVGEWTKAIILAAWGAIVVGHIDNILRPILVGDRLKLHPVVLFVSFLGGLTLFGAVGLVLGPLGVTITLTLLDIWRARQNDHTS